MPQAILVPTKDGPQVVLVHTIKSVKVVPGKAGTPAQDEQPEVKAEPGVAADPEHGVEGKAPVAAKPAKKAVPAVPATPEKVTIETEGGKVEANLTARQLVELLG